MCVLHVCWEGAWGLSIDLSEMAVFKSDFGLFLAMSDSVMQRHFMYNINFERV